MPAFTDEQIPVWSAFTHQTTLDTSDLCLAIAKLLAGTAQDTPACRRPTLKSSPPAQQVFPKATSMLHPPFQLLCPFLPFVCSWVFGLFCAAFWMWNSHFCPWAYPCQSAILVGASQIRPSKRNSTLYLLQGGIRLHLNNGCSCMLWTTVPPSMYTPNRWDRICPVVTMLHFPPFV